MQLWLATQWKEEGQVLTDSTMFVTQPKKLITKKLRLCLPSGKGHTCRSSHLCKARHSSETSQEASTCSSSKVTLAPPIVETGSSLRMLAKPLADEADPDLKTRNGNACCHVLLILNPNLKTEERKVSADSIGSITSKNSGHNSIIVPSFKIQDLFKQVLQEKLCREGDSKR